MLFGCEDARPGKKFTPMLHDTRRPESGQIIKVHQFLCNIEAAGCGRRYCNIGLAILTRRLHWFAMGAATDQRNVQSSLGGLEGDPTRQLAGQGRIMEPTNSSYPGNHGRNPGPEKRAGRPKNPPMPVQPSDDGRTAPHALGFRWKMCLAA